MENINVIPGDCADELPDDQPENISGFSGSEGWPPPENMAAGFLGGSDNDMVWPPMENMSAGFTVADMSAAGCSDDDVYGGLIGDEVDLYRPVIQPYNVSHHHGALVNTQDHIHNHAVCRSPMKRKTSQWQPYDNVKRAIKQLGVVSQDDMHTSYLEVQQSTILSDQGVGAPGVGGVVSTFWKLENQRSNLDLENVMPSSSISTQGIIPPLPPPPLQDNTRLWVKVEYNNDIVKFLLSLPTMDGLKTQVLKRYKLEAEALKFMYKDEDGEMITIVCDEDLHCCLEYFKSSGKAPVRLSLIMNEL